MNQVEGQPGKCNEQVRIGRGRAGDRQSYSIAGTGTGHPGMGWNGGPGHGQSGGRYWERLGSDR